LTLEAVTFLALAALRATGFGAAFLAFVTGFGLGLGAVFFAATLAALAGFRASGRAADFAALARFAFGLALTLATRFAGLAAARFAFERDADRRKPFARLLLMGL
jgi:hypothetical protein